MATDGNNILTNRLISADTKINPYSRIYDPIERTDH